MRIRVRLFAVQRELAGTREVGLDVPPDATVADAWDALVKEYPALRPGRDFVRFARNGAYADATTTLEDGDEVNLLARRVITFDLRRQGSNALLDLGF